MLTKNDLEIIKNKSLFTYKDAIVNMLADSVCEYYSRYSDKRGYNILKDRSVEIISDDFLWHYSEDFYKNKIRYVRKYLSKANPFITNETTFAPFLDGYPLIYSRHAYCYTTTSWELFEEKYRKEAVYAALKELLCSFLSSDMFWLAMFTAYVSKTPPEQPSYITENVLQDWNSIYFGIRYIRYRTPKEWIIYMMNNKKLVERRNVCEKI
ncbi:MAG TPA: hypothetical protein ENG48_04425 [Candidatus Atribacteria bacterium]|nr:hypothetical protein [Candidatus Atribacteria bacterium]